MLEVAFDVWVRDAEQKFLASTDYPLVADAEIDMAQELADYATGMVDPYSEECNPLHLEPAIDFFERRLIGSKSALPVRFVILNFLFRLAHAERYQSERAEELHKIVWPHIERFVRLQEVGVLEDAKAIRWEITNACAIHDWDRASTLYDLLKIVGAIRAPEHRALKGQMYLCSVVAPRDEDKDSPPMNYSLGWWVPKLDRAYGLGRNIRPLGLLAWGMTLASEAEYSAWEREKLSDAAHEWEIGFQQDSDLLGSYRAAWGKCYFLRENYLSAAKHFEHLLTRGCGLPDEIGDEPGPNLYLNTAECYQRAGDSARAIQLLNQCVAAFPKEKGLWLKLAEVHTTPPAADFEKAYQCLRQELENDPSFNENLSVSVALALCEVTQGGFSGALRKAVEAHPDHFQFMETVVAMHWPAFKSLDQKRKEEWVGAAHYLWGAGTNMQFREMLRRKITGTSPMSPKAS